MKPEKSLTRAFKDAKQWLGHKENEGILDRYSEKLNDFLGEQGVLSRAAKNYLGWIGHYYGNQVCDAFGRQEVQAVARSLPWAVAFRSLQFRFGAMDLPDGTFRMRMPRFETSTKAIGPAMLSDWSSMAINAPLLIAYAEAEMAHNIPSELVKSWGKGTIDAFNIGLLSQAFGVPTTYQPINPLVPELQGLLDHWRSTDEATFRAAMDPAVQFHIARSKHDTSKILYEFPTLFDWVFPAELLAVQALRQRDGLPAFETGHALVDAPWAMIQALPAAEPHPLLEQTEARIRADYPNFR